MTTLLAFYSSGTFERDRLSEGRGRLELTRTRELLRRFLPDPPVWVLDVGSGPGNHANWLAEDGYEVKLIDVTPKLVQQARHRAGEPRTFEAAVGDARDLAEPDESADAVLLLGPLYHLPARNDRMKALAEAHRVLRPGGLLAAAAISRYTSQAGGRRNPHSTGRCTRRRRLLNLKPSRPPTSISPRNCETNFWQLV